MWSKCNEFVRKVNNWCVEHSRISYIIVSAIFIIAWMPYFLTYFPGVIRYDEILCVMQALGELALSNHQPILFVLFIKIMIALVTSLGGSMNAAIAVGTAVQMCFLALVLSYVVSFIKKRTTSGWCSLVAIVFFAFSPIVALYSVVLCKDIFFTGWLIIYSILIYKICVEEYLNKPTWKNVIIFVFFATMVGMSRSNGIYIVVLMFIVTFFAIKKARKYIFACGVSVLLIIGLIKGPVFEALQVQSPSIAESFSVPIQQIANTLIQGGEIREVDLEYLDQLLPIDEWKASYNINVTDPIKFNEQFKRSLLDETAGEFLQVWFRNLIPNFKYYVEAYLNLMRGYWDISYVVNIDGTDVCANDYGIERFDYIERGTGLSIEPLLALLVVVMRKLPIVNILTNQSILFWLYFGMTIFQCVKRDKRKTMIYFPILIQYLTLLIAAPVSSEFRYMLSFHFLIPIFIWSAIEWK